MACSAEANGTTINCACSGCSIGYAHDDKKYIIVCCGTTTIITVKNQPDDPGNPPKPGHYTVDLSNITLLQAAEFLDKFEPGKIKIAASSMKQLKKAIKFKATLPFDKLVKKLGLRLA